MGSTIFSVKIWLELGCDQCKRELKETDAAEVDQRVGGTMMPLAFSERVMRGVSS